MRWSNSYQSSALLSKTVVIFRNEIDYMDEFVWQPYEGLIIPNDMDTLSLTWGWIEEWGNRRNTRLWDLHPFLTWDFTLSAEYQNWYVHSYEHLLRLSEYVPQHPYQPPTPQPSAPQLPAPQGPP
ncbi:hypothetical protein AHAS_Ahas01G0181300 [Arachis hypogaea]